MSEPTIVCIVGMHRSGTSLVAQLLHALGLNLGPEEHLMRPRPTPTGHWENEPITELNDDILTRLGGTWSRPPELAAGWERTPELDDLRHQARELIRSRVRWAPSRWGFKDPRTSLTAAVLAANPAARCATSSASETQWTSHSHSGLARRSRCRSEEGVGHCGSRMSLFGVSRPPQAQPARAR